MTFTQFMEQIYQIVISGVKKAGLSVALLITAVVYLEMQSSKREDKYEKEKNDLLALIETNQKLIQVNQAKIESLQTGYQECVVQKTVLTAKVENLENYVFRSKR